MKPSNQISKLFSEPLQRSAFRFPDCGWSEAERSRDLRRLNRRADYSYDAEQLNAGQGKDPTEPCRELIDNRRTPFRHRRQSSQHPDDDRL